MRTVKEAKEAARRWVEEEARKTPGIRGAFFHGSINWLSDEALLPDSSDLDIMVVLSETEPPDKPGKFRYDGVLLEVSYLSETALSSPEAVLGQYHLAGSFRSPGTLLDPTGWLTELQSVVGANYARCEWVYKRCEHARDRILKGAACPDSSPFPDQINAWLFPAGITTHILLVAGLKNPTVRTRYLAVRELLTDFGRGDFYEALLELLGCAHMHRDDAARHLSALTEAFDAAQEIIRSPFPFRADISAAGRPVAIDGSREMIERGDHREAIFWMVATYTRCQKVFAQDGSEEILERFLHGYLSLLSDLGITTSTQAAERRLQVQAFVPRVWDVAEAIIAANPAILA